jgi:PPOX class probable F420-dependent enzyme
MSIPEEFRGQKYLSLTTFRKTGVAVPTPVWFVENNDKLYLFTNPKSGKVKRIRNNPRVRIAPCSMRGRVTGPEFGAQARILPSPELAFSLLQKRNMGSIS